MLPRNYKGGRHFDRFFFLKSLRNITLGLISGFSGQGFLPMVLKGWMEIERRIKQLGC